eukprot:gene7574-7777_t
MRMLLPLLLPLLHAICQLQQCTGQEVGGGGWQRGRVTYFGAPEKIAAAYDPSRGKGSFGILAFGSCGYTNADGSLPFPKEQPAASADGSSDYPGSCGRCYEIRCDDSTEVLSPARRSSWSSRWRRNQTPELVLQGFRPVDCDSNAPVPASPGYINRNVIYSGGTKAGWSWQSYKSSGQQWVVPGGATGISFWIRSDAKSADIYESSTPQGQIPNLKLILQKQETKNYCPNEPATGSLTPAAGGAGGNSTAAGGWVQFVVPLSAFGCDGGLVNELTQLEFQNPNERNAVICVAEIRIQR